MQYWVCEHTTLVKPDSMDAIPRLVKWDLQTLQRRMKEKPLSSLTNTEVIFFGCNMSRLIPYSVCYVSLSLKCLINH